METDMNNFNQPLEPLFKAFFDTQKSISKPTVKTHKIKDKEITLGDGDFIIDAGEAVNENNEVDACYLSFEKLLKSGEAGKFVEAEELDPLHENVTIFITNKEAALVLKEAVDKIMKHYYPKSE